jgi:hypothetical protein
MEEEYLSSLRNAPIPFYSGQLDDLLAVLLLPCALCAGRNTHDTLTLPVPKYEGRPEEHDLEIVPVIPGAPLAAIQGNCIITDTDQVIKGVEFEHFKVREEVRQYFTNARPSLKSFASYRMGTNEYPVGVINIESNQSNVLGKEEEYYATFTALLIPFLKSMLPLVSEYAYLYLNLLMDKELNG